MNRERLNRNFTDLQRSCLDDNSVMIYASAVTKGGRSIIFCGDTYSGKTRNAIEYGKKGWKILGDDFVLLKDGKIYKTFLEPMHMKSTEGLKIPLGKVPLYYFYKIVRLLTKRRPYIFLMPEELGLQTADSAMIDRIVILGELQGKGNAEKIFNITRTKGCFCLDRRKDTKRYLKLMRKLIGENIK
jgi:hypothetical protein